MIRTIVFWGLYWGSLILGNYHLSPKPHTSTPSDSKPHRATLNREAPAQNFDVPSVQWLWQDGTIRAHDSRWEEGT